MALQFRADLFHLGPPKTATTWLYRCLKEHPQVVTSASDSIHFFDIHYRRGLSWYQSQFGSVNEQTRAFDPTPSYICSPLAPARIAAHNPEARLILTLRNPIDRGFSQFWHQKKKGGYPDEFDDVLKSYRRYSQWIEWGLVNIGLRRYLEYFPRESILALKYDDLKREPEAVLRNVFEFAGIDGDFRPSLSRTYVNTAGHKRTLVHGWAARLLRRMVDPARLIVRPGQTSLMQKVTAALLGQSQYQQGVSPELRAELTQLCLDDIQETESLLGLDLSHWYRDLAHLSGPGSPAR